MDNRVDTVSHNVDKQVKYESDLEQALTVAGIGWYNIKYSLVLALLLVAGIAEIISYSLILPAAVCDLQISDSQRGFVASIPYFGILITSYPWGYLVDTQGRKKMIIYSSLAAGIFSLLSGFMPNLASFAACKFLSSLCLACPSAVPYTYIGEILPAKYRDILLSIINATQLSGSSLVPLLAWAILPQDFRLDIGVYVFRPWRLLTMSYAILFIIAAIMLAFGPESPKFLVSQERYDEALNVLQNIYAGNKGMKPEEFPIQKLFATMNANEKGSFLRSLKVQTLPLLKWVYLKWLLLNAFLLFGIFAVTNGLYIWVPDVLNRVLTGNGESRTACQVISERLNQTFTESTICDDSIDTITFVINSVAQVCCALLAIAVSSTVKFIGKKRLLILCFFLVGSFCILINFITNDLLFAALMSSMPIMVLGMGPVNAYALEIFPTHLRGMAVSLAMMLGRTGSIIGANIAGLLINNACEAMFYLFGGLLIFCGALSFLLPTLKEPPRQNKENTTSL